MGSGLVCLQLQVPVPAPQKQSKANEEEEEEERQTDGQIGRKEMKKKMPKQKKTFPKHDHIHL